MRGRARCHASLYHEKARQSYDFEKQEWLNLAEVVDEAENLKTAADYYKLQIDEQLQSKTLDEEDRAITSEISLIKKVGRNFCGVECAAARRNIGEGARSIRQIRVDGEGI